eukprot:Phypoly_transcript_15252.p1 GENE.Phypoly_transcript_15252~~Phypoly_transcript_15252.p1  ORF type:complete len:228 (+),score=44.43 Phypoly_transcript_15252:210-893(+)
MIFSRKLFCALLLFCTFNFAHSFKYDRLNVNDSAVLLVDFQSGLQALVQDLEPSAFLTSVEGLATLAKYFKLPTVITTSRPYGPNGPLLPQISALFPNHTVINRPGEINAWDNPDFQKAVRALGKKQLILAGIVTDVCVTFLTLSLREAGYDVFVVTDASGTFTPQIAADAHARIATSGAQLLNLFAVACELARDWRTDLTGLANYFSQTIPIYGALISSFNSFTQH